MTFETMSNDIESMPISPPEKNDLDTFRKLIKNYIERHHYAAGLFWADKVVSLGNNSPIDVYWLAQCYFLTKQYHRAIHLINKNNLTRNSSCRYLAARCHYEVGQYQSTLDVLDHINDRIVCNKVNKTPLSLPEIDDTISIECSTQLLKGYAHEASDNRALAAESFRAAIKADPLCYEALQALTQHHMLTRLEEKEVLSNLQLSKYCSASESALVQLVYDTCVNKHNEINESTVTCSPLDSNLDYLTAQAEHLYYQCDFSHCYALTQEVLRKDPFHTECLPIHISCLVELKKPNALFLLGHKLVDLYPESALSWYAVGCYYYLIGKNDNARRYLSKSTTLDRVFGPAWISYGHSFAAENEHDQAMAAYFKAAQQMKGCHLPLLYIGMEYSLTNNPKIAEKFFKEALEIAPDDPFVLQELGVVSFTNQDYEVAEEYLRRAVEVVEENDIDIVSEKWSILLNNLAHACRKNNKLDKALHFHHQALRICPGVATTYSDLGLVQALVGNYEDSVVTLHKALSLHRDQTTTTTLLSTVMEKLTLQTPAFQGEENIQELDLPSELTGVDNSGNNQSNLTVNSTNSESEINMILGTSSIGQPVMHSSEIASESLDQTPQPTESSSALVIEDMVIDDDSPYSPGDLINY